MRGLTLIVLTAIALMFSACEDHAKVSYSPVEEFQKLPPRKPRDPKLTQAFDDALDGDDSVVIRSPGECERSADVATCLAREAQARAEHFHKAPRFVDLETCEAFYGSGRCQEAPRHSDGRDGSAGPVRFVPTMQGYVIGGALNRPVPVYFGRPVLCPENPAGCGGRDAGIAQGPLLSPNGHGTPPATATPQDRTAPKILTTTPSRSASR